MEREPNRASDAIRSSENAFRSCGCDEQDDRPEFHEFQRSSREALPERETTSAHVRREASGSI